MLQFSLFDSVDSLNNFLGNPKVPQNSISFQKSIQLDEFEEYPQKGCEQLTAWGLNHYYVPTVYNGKFSSFHELLDLTRTIARRDVTTAIAHASTFLAANTVWEGGDDEQKTVLAASILRGQRYSLGLTEEAHGSDLSATDTVMVAFENGYRLSGSKWLINNASMGDGIIVLARSDIESNYRNLSLMLVDKKRLRQDEYSLAPRIKTHGVRGADISGIRFHEAGVPQAAVIGEVGSGLETTMKALQISRTMCAGLSLGAAQTAMAVTLDFALSRRLYNDVIFTIPYVRRALIDAFVDILICDAVAISACRALHFAPEQFSVWSAVVKCFVPTTIEKIIRQLSAILGARHYLRENYTFGIFQKMMRDNELVSLFDGNTVINLQGISLQLKFLFSHFQRQLSAPEQLPVKRISSIFSLNQSMAPYQQGHLKLFNHGKDDCLSALITVKQQLQNESHLSHFSETAEAIAEAIGVAYLIIDEQVNLLAKISGEYGRGVHKSHEIYQMAQTYCKLHALSACINLWFYNRSIMQSHYSDNSWILYAVFRIFCSLGYEKKLHRLPKLLPAAQAEILAQAMERHHHENRSFSLFPYNLCPEKSVEFH